MGSVGPPIGGQLVEVVHDPDRVVAGLLGRRGPLDHLVEEGGRRVARGEVGDLQSEAHAPNLTAHPAARQRSGAHHPVRRRNQARATSPCAAWNGRRVGSPGGAGRRECDTKKPATAASNTVRASGSSRPDGRVERQQRLRAAGRPRARPREPRRRGRRPGSPPRRGASRRRRRRRRQTSTLSERTSPWTRVEPAQAAGHEASSSASRSRWARAHGSRPAGGPRPGQLGPATEDGPASSRPATPTSARVTGVSSSCMAASAAATRSSSSGVPGMPRRAPGHHLEGQRHPGPVVVGVEQPGEAGRHAATRTRSRSRAGAAPASRG